MILSVPHTGTRTLMQTLGETAFFHFCQNEAAFEGLDEHVDFPIRDPLATSLSWRCYQSNRQDMDEFRRWEAAIAYFKSKSEESYTVHRIEDLPILDGQSSNDFWWKKAVNNHDLDALKKLPEVVYLLEWYKRPEIQAFFIPHYPEGFWWQEKETQSS